jgi:hypothetical protein
MSYSGMAVINPLRKSVPQPDDAIMAALQDYHVVRIEEDINYNEKLTWCLEHCQNKFRDFKETRGRAWYFKEEQDAVLFAMKWS